jgi:hypothetical protein
VVVKEGSYKEFLLKIPETFRKLLVMAKKVLLFLIIMKKKGGEKKTNHYKKLFKIFKLKKN